MPDVSNPEEVPSESILNTIKKMLGLELDYDAFDTDIIVNINSVMMGLTQIGIGPIDGFAVTGVYETWSDFLGTTSAHAVKSFIYLKVKIMFDPPSSSFVLDAITKQASEFEWRLAAKAELKVIEEIEDETH